MLKLGISIRGKKNAIKLRFNNKSKTELSFIKDKKKHTQRKRNKTSCGIKEKQTKIPEKVPI